jgi:hypothetical protein
MTSLEITLVGGKGLVNGKKPSADSYVTVAYGKKKLVTEVCKQSLSPAWNETYTIELQEGGKIDPVIRIGVHHKDRISSEFMGKAEIDLGSLINGEAETRTLWLAEKSGTVDQNKPRGTVEVILRYTGLQEEGGLDDEEVFGAAATDDVFRSEDQAETPEAAEDTKTPDWVAGYHEYGQWAPRIHGRPDRVHCESFPIRVKQRVESEIAGTFG